MNNFETKCSKFKTIVLNKRQECDFELLVNGGFAPLKGFMNKNDYESCVNNMRLSNGKIWTMPITLCITKEQHEDLKHSDFVVLQHQTGLPLAIMDISKPENCFKPDLRKECVKVYGSDDDNHPYVKIIKNYKKEGKIYYLGGEITEYKLPPHYDFISDRLTPEQTKKYFKDNNWTKIIGFQTRNPMHRSHYELTQYALGKAGEGAKVLIHPVVGITQECDVNYHTRVKCYKKLMDFYPEDTAKLSLLPLAMRMAGPREAVWHACIRKNFGCTHFVVGRDHAGPSYKKKNGDDFYGHYDAQDLLISVADEIGIIPIISKLIVYALPKDEADITKGFYSPIDEINKDDYKIMKISGTQQREMLRNGEEIPSWFTYPIIYEELKKQYVPITEQGFCIYFTGLSGSGKTTTANFLISKIQEMTTKKITYLDGDIVRRHLSKGLGFSPEDRTTNVRRIGFVCSEVVKHGGIAVAANIAPYKKDRKFNRNMISANGNYIEVYVNTKLEECEKRDVKGLYALARKGVIKQFTGISDPYDVPTDCELELDGSNNIEENINIIVDYLVERGFLQN